jgi:hypothetical protein
MFLFLQSGGASSVCLLDEPGEPKGRPIYDWLITQD